MKLHYGFLFFDYLFKFILQLTPTKNDMYPEFWTH
jgi:hypothetical protein